MESKKTLLCFVVPFFGRMPEGMPFLLKTCATNFEYNWLLLTDDKTPYDYPENVRVKYCTFTELKERIQTLFDFPVSIDFPKRLCSFKPAYGYIFEEELKDCEYWGYCDLDQFFGRINRFLPPQKIKQYDKLYSLGHMTIFRNTKEINNIFKQKSKQHGLKIVSYEDIFKGLDVAFDEWPEESVNINTLCEDEGLKIYYANDFCDVDPFLSYYLEALFYADKRQWTVGPEIKFVIVYKNGCLYKVFKDKGTWTYSFEEILYAHLQKRRFSIKFDKKKSNFIIYNNKIVSFTEEEESKILKKVFRAVSVKSFFKVEEAKYFFKKMPERVKIFVYNKVYLLAKNMFCD